MYTVVKLQQPFASVAIIPRGHVILEQPPASVPSIKSQGCEAMRKTPSRYGIARMLMAGFGRSGTLPPIMMPWLGLCAAVHHLQRFNRIRSRS